MFMRTFSPLLTAGFFCFLSSLALAGDAVSERTANNGNVVLSGIPEIPPEIGQRLARYQNVRGAAFRGWTLDGKSMYISTRFGEVSQLHRVDMPLGARNQLTFFKEPVGQASRRPTGTAIAMTMDEGGNEFAQIFMLNPKNGNAKRLSDGESRNGGIVWSDDGELMAFRSTRRNGRSNDVWVMTPEAPEAAELKLPTRPACLGQPDESFGSPNAAQQVALSVVARQACNQALKRCQRQWTFFEFE